MRTQRQARLLRLDVDEPLSGLGARGGEAGGAAGSPEDGPGEHLGFGRTVALGEKDGAKYLRESGIKWMSSRTTRQ
jgi:hypothetical protein